MATLARQGTAYHSVSPGPDAGLTERVAIALRSSNHESIRAIQFETNAGVVTLNGRVPSYYCKQLAQELVWRLDGVKQVVNQTMVC